MVSGAGAAGIACAQMFVQLGVRREHMLVVDSVGVVHEGRVERMNPYKARFAADTDLRTLSEAIRGADVFVGVSTRDVLTPDMLRTMADDPIVLAMANPDPEIDYELAVQTRGDVVMATGRSDFPNQVNNVLGFPFIFRGALDVQASVINEAMKQAAVRAVAELAREDVPEQVLRGVRPARAAVRAHLPDPEAVRPARPPAGRPRGRPCRDRHRSGPPPDSSISAPTRSSWNAPSDRRERSCSSSSTRRSVGRRAGWSSPTAKTTACCGRCAPSWTSTSPAPSCWDVPPSSDRAPTSSVSTSPTTTSSMWERRP